jgi:hypothetical protein
MKNYQKVTFTYLKELNKDIKSNDVLKQEKAYFLLKTVKHRDVNPGLIMYIHYLKGKYYYSIFKRENSLESIKKAVECYCKIFQTARWYKVNAKNPKYYFKYAQSMYMLSKYVPCLFKQNIFRNKAYQITKHSSLRFEDNSSMNWLLSELNKS